MKVVLIGATGQLGSELLATPAEAGRYEWIRSSRQEIDLEKIDLSAWSSFLNFHRPDWVLNTAAFHNVPLCELEQDRAMRVNCEAVGTLAKICKVQGTRFMTFSTDYVFDGSKTSPYVESDPSFPVQSYGKSKREGEKAVFSEYSEGSWIVRSCGLYGMRGSRSKGGNFINGRVDEARKGGVQQIADEQKVSPTSALDLARGVLQLISRPETEPGLYHMVSEGSCSWAEFAAFAVTHLGLPGRVEPVDRHCITDHVLPDGRTVQVRRPRNSVLSNQKINRLGIQMPDWRAALVDYLSRRS